MTRTTWKNEANLRPQELLNCLPMLEFPLHMDWVESEDVRPDIIPAGLQHLTIGGGSVRSGRSRSPAREAKPEYRTRSPLSYVGPKHHIEHKKGIFTQPRCRGVEKVC